MAVVSCLFKILGKMFFWVFYLQHSDYEWTDVSPVNKCLGRQMFSF